MAYFHYERLTALDSMFLDIENHSVHMHVGGVALFEPGPLRLDGGGVAAAGRLPAVTKRPPARASL